MKNRKEDPPGKKKTFKQILFNVLYLENKGKKGIAKCFRGEYRTITDESGNKAFTGKVHVYGKIIRSTAENKMILGDYLDTLTEMVILIGLNENAGVKSVIAGREFFHN